MARPLAVVLLVAALLLAGCFRPSSSDAGDEDPSLANDSAPMPTTLPDGREFAAAQETNRTVSSETLDGKLHKHDYWKGKETVTVFDADVSVGLTPVFERGDTSKVFEGFLNLGKLPDGSNESALVFEGTGKVVFTLASGPAWATSYQVTFRTAAKDWSPWQTIEVGKPFEYTPERIETDMPHSIRSLWNWKIQAVAPVPVTDVGLLPEQASETIHATIVVQKSASVEDWPPHPEFYGPDVKERFVMPMKQGKTNVQNAADVLVYGVEPDQLVPDLLVSMGTAELDVFVNVTSLTLPPGVPNGGFTLYWRTANTTPNSLGVFSLANETDAKSHAYWRLKLTDDVVDSPYQPKSRFGFKVLANAADDSVVACYRCVPYTIEYTMTIVARPGSAENATALPP